MRFFTDIEYVICYGLTDTGTVTNLDTQSSQACTVCTVDTLQYISVYFVQKLTGLYSMHSWYYTVHINIFCTETYRLVQYIRTN